MSKKSNPMQPMSLARRRFFKNMIGVSAAGLAGVSGLASLQAFAEDMDMVVRGPAVPDQPVTQVSEHVWCIIAPDGFPTPGNQGLMSNVTFVVTSEGVVILDSGASLQIGEMALRQIRTVTDKPVIAVINTHYHGDHWLGNHAFVEAYPDVPIYAHPFADKAIRGHQGEFWLHLMERSTDNAIMGTIVTPPNRHLDHGDELKFGDVTLRMHHYGTAHTPSDVCVEVVEDEVMHVGDVAMDRRIAFMDDGSYLGTFKTFDELEKTGITLWVPGHGLPGPDVLKNNRELFMGIWEAAKQAVDDMAPISEVKDRVLADPRVAKWADVTKGFEDNIGKYSSLAYLEAEATAF